MAHIGMKIRSNNCSSRKTRSTKGRPVSKKRKTNWDKLKGGAQRVVRQGNNAASVSMNLRIGSRQLRSYLGTTLSASMGAAGMYVGLAAAGLKTASGLQKLTKAVKTREVSTGLDGIKDLGSAAVTGFAAASMVAARMVALPIYAGFNTFRGLYTIASGVKDKNKKRQFLGLRRTVSSAGLAARSLKRVSPVLKTAGIALAPVAGGLQVGQGVYGLVTGLKEDNNKKELRGVVDIASGVGLTLLLTGLAATPGLALFGLANFAYSAYTMSKTVRKVMDKAIDRLEPPTRKGLEHVSRWAAPVARVWDTDTDDFFSVINELDDIEDPEDTDETEEL